MPGGWLFSISFLSSYNRQSCWYVVRCISKRIDVRIENRKNPSSQQFINRLESKPLWHLCVKPANAIAACCCRKSPNECDASPILCCTICCMLYVCVFVCENEWERVYFWFRISSNALMLAFIFCLVFGSGQLKLAYKLRSWKAKARRPNWVLAWFFRDHASSLVEFVCVMCVAYFFDVVPYCFAGIIFCCCCCCCLSVCLSVWFNSWSWPMAQCCSHFTIIDSMVDVLRSLPASRALFLSMVSVCTSTQKWCMTYIDIVFADAIVYNIWNNIKIFWIHIAHHTKEYKLIYMCIGWYLFICCMWLFSNIWILGAAQCTAQSKVSVPSSGARSLRRLGEPNSIFRKMFQTNIQDDVAPQCILLSFAKGGAQKAPFVFDPQIYSVWRYTIALRTRKQWTRNWRSVVVSWYGVIVLLLLLLLFVFGAKVSVEHSPWVTLSLFPIHIKLWWHNRANGAHAAEATWHFRLIRMNNRGWDVDKCI